MLVVKSKIKEHADGLNVAGDFANALDKEVEVMVQKACARAKANGRKTLQARDL
ncbi:DUF1931 domain-containing protein [Candidatus Woesearchaeota archaeon]|jgi:hypothetical protein|nr:DUF1931 domain-containing protein [Candidatus Woesearchaeota archaeon]MBT4321790.1 DUF1931 domain-containing protein [Candidatus Woesearchaeota archaeon]MBT4630601.1 DUF1931 domain-containing protein [Candidatus Woesearchaeota archaeon]